MWLPTCTGFSYVFHWLTNQSVEIFFTSVESTNNYVGACKCTDGKFENQYGECVHKDECPCTFRNRFYNVLQWL